jgi:hypothetical protein
MPGHRGTSRGYLLKKLKRAGKDDLLRVVSDGRISAFAAAEAAGLRRRFQVLGTGHSVMRQRREFALRAAELSPRQELELWLGPSGDSAFASDEDRRAAWFRYGRDRLMPHFSSGRRPQAWWRYEAKLPYPGIDRERSVLYVEGQLTEAEARELLKFWRAEFERANAPDFVFHWNGRLLRGAVARRAHYSWADVPLEEAVTWTRERRRAARAIRAMAPAA